ncbi:MAG: O-antigen ligase family protein [Deferribacteres bacterium]|nr:O-antigen ligase family protein [Deferribacteres bacterium]
MKNRFEIIDRIIEYGIYVYIFLMFLSKGEGIRNIIIFGNLGLWLLTFRYRKKLYILKGILPRLCWIYLATFVFSVIFSLDPLFSLKELKGDPLKFASLFPVVATVMADKARLEKAVYTIFFTITFIVFIGYYSYIYHDIPMLKPDTVLLHAWHNRFAGYINTLLPFAFILYLLLHKPALKAGLIILYILSVLALVLSTSRGGYAAFVGIVFVWCLYLSRTKGYSFKRIAALLVIIFLLLGSFSYVMFPDVRTRIANTSTELVTFNERTELWGAAFYAILNRPVFGWGYGERFYRQDEPFLNTPYKKAPPKGEHNLFLTVLFHQGIVGFIPFLLLILTTIRVFWKEALKSKGIKSYVLIACVSVFVGNYVIHAQLESMFRLQHIAVVLGLGMAAGGIGENKG